ncbi:MAG: DUF1376 domain-containing protein [Desulfatitalea sp.]
MANEKIDIWLPLFVGDYLSDTMHLSTEQHGAYLLIMMAYWKNMGPLCESRMKSVTKLTDDAWSMHRALLEEFFDTVSVPGKWVHKRLEKEIKKAMENKKTRVDKARDAAGKRWGKRDGDEF